MSQYEDPPRKTPAPAAVVTPASVEVRKREEDKRRFQAFSLPNGVRLLEIETPVVALDPDWEDCSTGCIAVCVSAGEADDPNAYVGSAHVLEHMILHGNFQYATDRFEFKNRIGSLNGTTNGCTSSTTTTFFVKVRAKNMSQAALEFIPLFRERTLLEEMLNMELQITKDDSNSQKSLRNFASEEVGHMRSNYCRVQSVLRNEAKIHDQRRSVVTAATEQGMPTVLNNLHAFFDEHYKPKNIAIVVIGPKPMDEVIEVVATEAAKITDRSGKHTLQMEHGRIQTPRIIYVPLICHDAASNRPELMVRFQIPGELMKNHAVYYVKYALMQGGESELEELLTTEGYISEFRATTSKSPAGGLDLTIEFQLTESGSREIEQILRELFSFVRAVAGQRPKKPIFDMLKQGCVRLFEAKPPMSQMVCPETEAVPLSRAMHRYPTEMALFGAYDMGDFQENAPFIEKIFEQLVPENAYVVILASAMPPVMKNATAVTEPVYKVEYCTKAIEHDMLARIQLPTGKLPKDITVKIRGKGMAQPSEAVEVEKLSTGESSSHEGDEPRIGSFASAVDYETSSRTDSDEYSCVIPGGVNIDIEVNISVIIEDSG